MNDTTINATSPETDDDAAPLRLRLDAGPDAGRTITFPEGQVVVGRSPGPGHIADPFLEAHHLLVDPTRRTVLQLSGRVPVRVDGNPVATVAPVSDGSVIEMGASRIVVITAASPATTPPNATTAAVRRGEQAMALGVGVHGGQQRTGPISFADQARDARTLTATTIALEMPATRRILVVGPPAEMFARALAARSGCRPVTVSGQVSLLQTPPWRRRIVIVHAADPETGWPGLELPPDAAMISVGATWQAVLMRPSPDGSISLQRFHAAGHPGGADPRTPVEVCSRVDRTLVTEEVARPRAELGGDVVGVPEPARRQRQATASDALVELVAHPGEQCDLLVEARSP